MVTDFGYHDIQGCLLSVSTGLLELKVTVSIRFQEFVIGRAAHWIVTLCSEDLKTLWGAVAAFSSRKQWRVHLSLGVHLPCLIGTLVNHKHKSVCMPLLNVVGKAGKGLLGSVKVLLYLRGPVLWWGEAVNKIFGKSKRSHPFPAAGGRLVWGGLAFLPGNSCHPHSFSHSISGAQLGALGSGVGMLGCRAPAPLQLAEVWCNSQSCWLCLCKKPALAVEVFKPLRGITEVGNVNTVPPPFSDSTH